MPNIDLTPIKNAWKSINSNAKIIESYINFEGKTHQECLEKTHIDIHALDYKEKHDKSKSCNVLAACKNSNDIICAVRKCLGKNFGRRKYIKKRKNS